MGRGHSTPQAGLIFLKENACTTMTLIKIRIQLKLFENNL